MVAAVQAGAGGGETRGTTWRAARALVTAFQVTHDCLFFSFSVN